MKLAFETKELYETALLGACEVKENEFIFELINSSEKSPITIKQCLNKKMKGTLVESKIISEMPIKIHKDVVVENMISKGVSLRDLFLLTKENVENFIPLKDFLEGIDMKFPIYPKSEQHVEVVKNFLRNFLEYPFFSSIFSCFSATKDYIFVPYGELQRIFSQSKFKGSEYLFYSPLKEEDIVSDEDSSIINFDMANVVVLDNPKNEDFNFFMGLKNTKLFYKQYSEAQIKEAEIEEAKIEEEQPSEETKIEEEKTKEVKEEKKVKKVEEKKPVKKEKVHSRLIAFIYKIPSSSHFRDEKYKKKYFENFYSFVKS